MVTKIIEQIGLCRNCLVSRDYKLILRHIYTFTQVWSGVKRHVDKYVRDSSHELDFNIYDLEELCTELREVLDETSGRINYLSYYKAASEMERITNDTLRELCTTITNITTIDTELRKCYNIVSYYCLVLKLWNLQNERQDLDYVVLETIRSFLKK